MSKQKPDSTPERVLHKVIGFPRALRQGGFPVGTSQVLDYIRALSWVDVADRQTFYHAAQATLVNDFDQLIEFRRAFLQYWDQAGGQSGIYQRPRREMAPGEGEGLGDEFAELAAANADGRTESDPGGAKTAELLRYSPKEALWRKDFAALDEQELAAVRWLIAELELDWGRRKSRRWKPGGGDRVDLRRSLRANLRHGGEWIHWARRGPRQQERALVVLADISGSMEVYTRLLLQFVYGLVRRGGSRTEAFVFGTRLTRVTRLLQAEQPQQALRRVAQDVPDWSGGTRIGEALRTFNTDWARRVLGSGAVVLLVSDGWDRGDPELLRREVARLQRSSQRLIWLNPLLGSSDYEPRTRGLQAALPFVDDFMPVHNVASLETLVAHLQELAAPQSRVGARTGVGGARTGGF